MKKFYYIIPQPKTIKELYDLEDVILGKVKEQRVLKNGKMVVELADDSLGTPNAIKNFEKHEAKDILNEIDKIEQ